MPDFKEIAKGGWHPKGKAGKGESWRGDFKGVGQVAGWLGKGKDSQKDAEEHVSRPLTALKDPKAFGPPPKHINYHGGAAMPNQTTPDRGGWGAPIPQTELSARQQAEEADARRIAEEEAQPKGPPVPFRADTTGLSTANLPPPPGRKDGADGRSPALVGPTGPKLPPRLPPRQSSSSSPSPPPPPYTQASQADPHRGVLNQGALNRLGAAGVSVPSFGIGPTKGKAPLPPPSLPSNSRIASPASPTANTSQLNEIQSRFSRLTTSSQQAESPKQGTTFAEKQAALKTASSFRNDPSSVSLSDARTAASTANNFRERHGEQVKSGWTSVNKLNSKYGIADKVGSLGGVAAPERTPAAEMREVETPSALGKKKPAPPPPRKRPDLSATGAQTPPLPPPINLATKPKPQSFTSSSSFGAPSLLAQTDFPLDLPSLWFAQSPPIFPPPSIDRLPGKRICSYSTGWSSSGVRKTHTLTGIIRDTSTLASTKIRLTWDASNPSLTVKAEQQHIPPPRALSPAELEVCRQRYSESIATWCEGQKGTQVGNGECWTLANNALLATGHSLSGRGLEPPMSSQSYVHGSCILALSQPGANTKPIQTCAVQRGDIMQFLTARFEAPHGRSWKTAGAPDHTAVVVGVDADGSFRVLEQNTGGVKIVVDGRYDVRELVSGEVRVYRAVGEGWAGKLDPTW